MAILSRRSHRPIPTLAMVACSVRLFPQRGTCPGAAERAGQDESTFTFGRCVSTVVCCCRFPCRCGAPEWSCVLVGARFQPTPSADHKIFHCRPYRSEGEHSLDSSVHVDAVILTPSVLRAGRGSPKWQPRVAASKCLGRPCLEHENEPKALSGGFGRCGRLATTGYLGRTPTLHRPDNLKGSKVPPLSLVTVRVGAPLPRLQFAFSGTLLLRNKSGTTPQNPFFLRRQLRQLDYKRRATFLAGTGSRRLAPRLSLARAMPMDGGLGLLTTSSTVTGPSLAASGVSEFQVLEARQGAAAGPVRNSP